MKREIKLKNMMIEYELDYKNVKNINLRINSDGEIRVSANRWISQRVIDEFVISKEKFILSALEKFKSRKERPVVCYFSEEELRCVIINLCENIYPYFEKRGVKYPRIKFRRMVSQWGNCRFEKGILTFSTNLMYAPLECVEYVVAHEFIHFLVPNHSPGFYAELSKIMPDWKNRRQKLKEIQVNG